MLKNKPKLKLEALKVFNDKKEQQEESRKKLEFEKNEKCYAQMVKIFPDLELRNGEIWLDDIHFKSWRSGTKYPSLEEDYSLLADGYYPVYDMASLGSYIKTHQKKGFWQELCELCGFKD